MANVPIVTEVTFAQLEALVAANGLNEGLQYKVTDKGWLLLAISVNTLKAATGELTMLNSGTLPDYISVDLLFIDTGNVTDTELTKINLPTNYYPVFVELKITATADVANYFYQTDINHRIGNEDLGVGSFSEPIQGFSNSGTHDFKILQIQSTGGEIFRSVISCFRFKAV